MTTPYIEGYLPFIQYHGLNTKQNVTMDGGNFDASGSSGTFKTSTGAHTINGAVTMAAGKGITYATGAGAFDMSASTGPFKFPTGAVSGLIPNVVSGSGATVTLTAAQAGSIVLFDRAAGIVFTLPAPVVGLTFTFLVAVTVTSNNAKVITDTGTTLLAGFISSGPDNTANKQWVGNGTTHIAVTQNGTTTGGIVGSTLVFSCVTSTLWVVEGELVASGIPVTPFATS